MLTMTGRHASARPIRRTPRKKKLELDARNGRVAGRQLFINETWEARAGRQGVISFYLKQEEIETVLYLFDVEDEKVLDGADSWQERAVEGADPADGLAVYDLKHVLRDGELLLAPPLGQAAVTVPHNQPAEETMQKRPLQLSAPTDDI